MKKAIILRYLAGMLAGSVLINTALANAPSPEGIAFQSTRVIYPEVSPGGITFSVGNDTSALYLLQSWVEQWNTRVHEDVTAPIKEPPTAVAPDVPFIVTPPLERLEVGETTTLRLRLTQKPPVTDRESVFALQIKAIPNQPEKSEPKSPTANKNEVEMTFALQNTVKLFYRPRGLPDYDEKIVANELQFHRDGAEIVVSNPTVFYVTLDTLSVGGKSVEDKMLFKMVPPLGMQRYPLPANVTAGQVEWTLITDYGGKTDPLTRPLTATH